MANSRTLLVYVLALLLCGSGNSRFWASANTVIGNRDPLIGSPQASSSSQQQTRPQHHYAQFHQQQQQSPKVQDSSSLLPPSPSTGSQSSSLPPPSSSSSQIVPSTQLQPHTANGPSTMSVKNGFGFSAGNSQAGPYTTGYGYISGRTLNQPSHSYMTDYDLAERQGNGNSASFLSVLSNIVPDLGNFLYRRVDLKSVLLGAAVGAGATMFASGTRLANIFPLVRQLEEESFKSTPAPNNASSSSPDASSSRRRRRDVEFDTDLTELATMVLSAIQSGECMQRSICLMGSRIGSSEKGKMGFLLADKLIPESVQGSQYFVTLKKALRGGESYCDRFRCRFN